MEIILIGIRVAVTGCDHSFDVKSGNILYILAVYGNFFCSGVVVHCNVAVSRNVKSNVVACFVAVPYSSTAVGRLFNNLKLNIVLGSNVIVDDFIRTVFLCFHQIILVAVIPCHAEKIDRTAGNDKFRAIVNRRNAYCSD